MKNLAFEVEVEDAEGTYYVSIVVNDLGEPEEFHEDCWWAYTRPVDEIAFDNDKEYQVYKDFKSILNEMILFWNTWPVFDGAGKWIKWPAAR